MPDCDEPQPFNSVGAAGIGGVDPSRVRPTATHAAQFAPTEREPPASQPFAAILTHNRRGWDDMACRGHPLARPASEEEVREPLANLDLSWIDGGVSGKRILCLAGGGGRQSVLYAAAGADVTVVDLSPAMLALDRQMAARHGLNLRTILTTMHDLSMLAPECFDVVLQPVSTCYVPDVKAVYHQVARVLVPGGLYISQHKQPTSLQASVQPGMRGYELEVPYYHAGPLPPVQGSPHREYGTLEFLHRWEELLGGLCRAGFVIEDVAEPLHARADAAPGTFAHRCMYIPPYVRIKARRTGSPAKRVWVPGS